MEKVIWFRDVYHSSLLVSVFCSYLAQQCRDSSVQLASSVVWASAQWYIVSCPSRVQMECSPMSVVLIGKPTFLDMDQMLSSTDLL